MKEAQARLRPPAPSEAEWREYVKWHAQAGYRWALDAVKNLEPLERAEAMVKAPPVGQVHSARPRQGKPFVGRDLSDVPVERRQASVRRAPKPAKPASDPSWLDHEAKAGVPVVDLYPDKVARDPNVELRAPLETLPNWTRDGRRKPRLGDADTLEERPFGEVSPRHSEQRVGYAASLTGHWSNAAAHGRLDGATVDQKPLGVTDVNSFRLNCGALQAPASAQYVDPRILERWLRKGKPIPKHLEWQAKYLRADLGLE